MTTKFNEESILEIYDPETLEIKTSSTISGNPHSVKDFLDAIRNNFFPDCLIKVYDPNDPQIEMIF